MAQRQSPSLLPLFLSLGFMLLWFQVAPRFFPNLFPENKKVAEQRDPLADVAAAAKAPPVAPPERDPDSPIKVAAHPSKKILLGEPGFDAGYLIQAELTTQGAAAAWVQLTDPRYTTLNRQEQLKIVGNPVVRNIGGTDLPQTFDTTVSAINEQLKPYGQTLETAHWELAANDVESATFRYRAPDGALEVQKTYRIHKVPLETRDESPEGYLMDLSFDIKNTSQAAIKTQYSLVGPVGLPLENLENARLFHEIKLGTQPSIDSDAKITPINVTASAIVKEFEAAQQPNGKPVQKWLDPAFYAGIDEQFFAALIFPQYQPDQIPKGIVNPYLTTARPELLYKAPQVERSDLTLVLQSDDVSIPAGEQVSLNFKTFFGPKRPDLLSPLRAEPVIQLGWFGAVAKLMLAVLGFFHGKIGLPYAAAIVLLTVVVRGLMFPISRKQAIEGEKMKVLAPKLKEIQDKNKGNPEEFARAYRDFQKKYNYHPMVGCLPALIQLPIFLGLYNALFHAVDLRLARFLWVDNLAAPDALFHFPAGFSIPWLGWTEFNLLPVVTVALFIVQQKMFMPPALSEEQRLQQKMMNWMMIIMLFMFYRVPAGLCLYFIASSLWGMAERQILKKKLAATSQPIGEPVVEILPSGAAAIKPEGKKFETPGWLGKIIDAADQAKHATEGQGSRQFGKKNKRTKR